MIQKGSGDFEVLSGDVLVMSGTVKLPEPTDQFLVSVSEISVGENSIKLTSSDIYSEFQHRGHKYSADFKPIKFLNLTENGKLFEKLRGDCCVIVSFRFGELHHLVA